MVALDLQAGRAAERLAHPVSDLLEASLAHGDVQLGLDAPLRLIPAEVIAGDVAYGAVVAVVVRDDGRPAAERVQDVAARVALLATDLFPAVRALLVPGVVEAEQRCELVFFVMFLPRANLALALLVRGRRSARRRREPRGRTEPEDSAS